MYIKNLLVKLQLKDYKKLQIHNKNNYLEELQVILKI